jgi:hypothetical protein
VHSWLTGRLAFGVPNSQTSKLPNKAVAFDIGNWLYNYAFVAKNEKLSTENRSTNQGICLLVK